MGGRVVRRRMRAVLPRPGALVAEGLRPVRVGADLDALAELMLAAYAGTPDAADVGPGVADAARELTQVFAGENGQLVPEASFVAEEGERLVAAGLVTIWKQEPLLAYVFTAPDRVGRGLAAAVIMAAMRVLGDAGQPALNLAVTPGNRRASRLYAHLGFREV